MFECGRVIEQRRVACPLRFKFAARKFPQPNRGIGHAHKLLIHIVQHDPVVALPVHYGWQRHEREIAYRDLQCARRQSKFSCGAGKRLEAGAVRSRVTELPNPCQAYLAAEIPADHSETGCTTIHLVDLHHMIDFADALAAFPKQTALVCERLFFVFAIGWGLLAIQLHLVLHVRFRGQQFGREVKGDACFCFCLVKREAFAQQFIELGKPASQVLHRLRFQREQLAICECFHGRRARRSVQDR